MEDQIESMDCENIYLKKLDKLNSNDIRNKYFDEAINNKREIVRKDTQDMTTD